MSYFFKADALLMLEDGTFFNGKSVGVKGFTVGEVVFNTAMTGYQEIMTDPSYASQIITFTYPHIGNTGVNNDDNESNNIWATGVVMRDFVAEGSNYRTNKSFQSFLQENNVIAISEIDTRQLTQHIRQHGCLRGCIMCGNVDKEYALSLTKQWQPKFSPDLINMVTCNSIYDYNRATHSKQFFTSQNIPQNNYKIVVYDFGVKRSILNNLVDSGFTVKVVPASTTLSTVSSFAPDGIVFSNGPGDPRGCKDLVSQVVEALATGIPILGICLGHQLLSLAYGAKIFKMKFGHHGANHPVYLRTKNVVAISSQNHNYAVSSEALPKDLTILAHSLFDGTIQYLEHNEFRSISFQGHPEAGPGPRDCYYIFNYFREYIKENKKVKNNAKEK